MRPPRENAPAVAAARGAEGTAQDRADIVREADAADKRTATLIARAALVGIALHRLADGRWSASRWAYSRTLDDREVEDWLRMVAGDAR